MIKAFVITAAVLVASAITGTPNAAADTVPTTHAATAALRLPGDMHWGLRG